MLTIRTIDPDGLEVVREIRNTMLRPAKESPTGSPCLTYFLEHSEGNDWPDCVDVYCGTVYVMNESGKTVASYFLGNVVRIPIFGEDGNDEIVSKTGDTKEQVISVDGNFPKKRNRVNNKSGNKTCSQ